ncbi:g4634 [Coccomyxa viridis]|uniref:G4634 protein n=1 Tax=Coccomyxa viridis TaxID=1274662 RepID=A0ABP1FQS3_9CHLO
MLRTNTCPASGECRAVPAQKDLLRRALVHSAPLPCRSRRLVEPTALAYPRAFQRSSSSAPDISQQANGSSAPVSTSSDAAPVTYMGPEDKVAGHMLFMHLRRDCTMGQVVALCNGLVGRVPCGGKQAVHAHLRPISLSTPAGRFDWDPVGEELPAHMWTLLGAPAHELKLKMLTISLSSDADLAALRQHVAGIVEYIQHGNLDSGLSASF